MIRPVLNKLRKSKDVLMTYSSVLAAEGVVSRPSGLSGRPSGGSSTKERSTQMAPFSSVSTEPLHVTVDCMETIQQFARHSRFSYRVPEQLAFARHKSFEVIYKYWWSMFQKQCRDHGHSSSRPSLSKVANLLLFFFKVRWLFIAAIKGHRSILSSVFQFSFPEIASSSVLRNLIKSFQINRLACGLHPPSWDLEKALRAFHEPPYEL